MLDKSLLKNITSLFSIKIASYLIPLITLPYLVRVLEPTGYGQLGFAMAIIQYFIILVNYGFDLSATQKIAQCKNDKVAVSKVFWNVTCIRLVAAFIGLIALYPLTLMSEELYKIKEVLFIFYLSVFGAALFPQWLFQGKERLGIISTAQIVLQVLSVPLIFIFVISNNDVGKAALISSMPSLLMCIYSAYLIKKRRWIIWYKPTFNQILNELYDGWHLFISSAAISLYTTSVVVVLGFVSGPESVAIYVGANKLLKAAFGIYTPISAAYYPRINSLISKSKDEALIAIKYLMKIQFFLTLFISVSLFLFSPVVIPILFGNDYSDSIVILQLLSCLPIIVGLSNIFGVQVLISFGFKKAFSKVLIISGCMSLIFLFPLCYFYSTEGAAIAAVTSELLVTLLMFLVVIKKKIPLFNFIRKV